MKFRNVTTFPRGFLLRTLRPYLAMYRSELNLLKPTKTREAIKLLFAVQIVPFSHCYTVYSFCFREHTEYYYKLQSQIQFKKYKTFSVLIYSYINTSGNWKNEKLCGNTTPAGRSVFIQFRVFPIFTSVDITVYQYGKNVLYFFYNIAQKTSTEEWREIFRVDIELYQHGS